jgi:hypothetical protein
VEVLKKYFVKNELPGSFRTVCQASASLASTHRYPLILVLSQSNNVLFPEPKEASDLNHDEHHSRNRRPSGPVIALAGAMGLVLISLLISYVRGRRSKMAPPAVCFTREVFQKTDEEKDQGDQFSVFYPARK